MTRSKIDANQREIVAALVATGATVQSLATVGDGCPDVLVGWHGRNLLMEIKDGSKTKSARKLTPKQIPWHRDWQGEVYVVESVGEALAVLNMYR